jgi:hypothetical protein
MDYYCVDVSAVCCVLGGTVHYCTDLLVHSLHDCCGLRKFAVFVEQLAHDKQNKRQSNIKNFLCVRRRLPLCQPNLSLAFLC